MRNAREPTFGARAQEASVHAVILCGGQGTRLREETEFRPKPLVEIGGRPILWHIMKLYAHYGIRDFILCLGYRSNAFKEYFLNYEAMNNDFTICLGQNHQITYHDAHREQDFKVTLADTGLNTMTGARLKTVQRHVFGDTCMVTYGDGLSDVDLGQLLAFHKSHGRLATLTTVRPLSRFGVIELGRDGEVMEFSEKPQAQGWINAGFFIFEPGVFDYLSVDPSCVLEREPLEKLCRDRELVAFQHDGFFYAMDTYREYLHLNDLWTTGRAPWAVWNAQERRQDVPADV